jgi:hypothetical protein
VYVRPSSPCMLLFCEGKATIAHDL